MAGTLPTEIPTRVDPDWSPEQVAAHAAFVALLKQPKAADEAYDALPGTQGGRIVSTDLARFLDVRYRDTPPRQPRDLAPGWDLAWRYAQDRLRRSLNRPTRGQARVRFMAGGWAAGKTHALEKADLGAAQVAWDGTLQDSEWAHQMIELAVRNGWRVEVAYVFRDIELAIYGAVERAESEGRSVPLVDLPANHRAVQQSMLRLVEGWGRSPQVAFILLHNMGAKGVTGKSHPITLEHLAPGGALHYSKAYEEYYRQAAEAIGRISMPR